MRNLYGALFCGVLFLAAPSAANAITFTADMNEPTPLGVVPSPTSTTGNFYDNINASILPPPACPAAGCTRSPWDDTSNPGEDFSSVSGGGSATYDFAGNTFSGLNILWGSPDPYNHIDFYLANVIVDTFSGSAFVPVPTPLGNPQVGWANVAFSGAFDKFVLRSEVSDAFEFANLQAVPVPAALPLFAGGLGLLGWLARRRRQPTQIA
jgi:hypothetical protein